MTKQDGWLWRALARAKKPSMPEGYNFWNFAEDDVNGALFPYPIEEPKGKIAYLTCKKLDGPVEQRGRFAYGLFFPSEELDDVWTLTRKVRDAVESFGAYATAFAEGGPFPPPPPSNG